MTVSWIWCSDLTLDEQTNAMNCPTNSTIKLVANSQLVDELGGSDCSPIHLHLTTTCLTKLDPRIHPPPNRAALPHLSTSTSSPSQPFTPQPLPLGSPAPQHHTLVTTPPRHPPIPPKFLRRMNEPVASVFSAVPFKSTGCGRTRSNPSFPSVISPDGNNGVCGIWH